MGYSIQSGARFVYDDDGELIGVVNAKGELRLFVLALPEAGTPTSRAKSTLTVDMTNELADITVTARGYGSIGDEISIEFIDPSEADQELGIVVTGKKITVNLATDGDSIITSTGADVAAAINESVAASALVIAEDEGAGSGVVEAKEEANLTGGAVTTPGPVGAFCFAADNSKVYRKVSAESWVEIAAPAAEGS